MSIRILHISLFLTSIVLSQSFCGWFASPDTVRIVFGGDVMLARNVGEQIEKSSPDYPWLGIKKYLSQADIAVVNLECVVGTQQRSVDKKWVFEANPAVLAGLKNAGIDCVSLANNHNYDYFGTGVVETVDSVWSAGIVPVGAGRNAEEFFAPRSFYVRGNWFAIIGLNDTKSGYWGDDEPGCAPTWKAFGESLAVKQIATMKKLGALVIVFEHWGREYDTVPRKRQIELAHKFIDAGASAVIGSHPHRLQGIEFYGGGIIAYSLGNLVFDQHDFLGNIGGLLEIDISNGSISEVKMLPTETIKKFAQPHSYSIKDAKISMKKLCEPFNSTVSIDDKILLLKPKK